MTLSLHIMCASTFCLCTWSLKTAIWLLHCDTACHDSPPHCSSADSLTNLRLDLYLPVVNVVLGVIPEAATTLSVADRCGHARQALLPANPECHAGLQPEGRHGAVAHHRGHLGARQQRVWLPAHVAHAPRPPAGRPGPRHHLRARAALRRQLWCGWQGSETRKLGIRVPGLPAGRPRPRRHLRARAALRRELWCGRICIICHARLAGLAASLGLKSRKLEIRPLKPSLGRDSLTRQAVCSAFLGRHRALLGARAGVLFNVLFPEWLQTALLVVLLGLVVKKTATKGAKQWQQEQKAKAEAAEVRTHGNFLLTCLMSREIVFPEATGVPRMPPVAPEPCGFVVYLRAQWLQWVVMGFHSPCMG